MARIKYLQRHLFIKITKDNPVREIHLDKSVSKIKDKVSSLIYFWNYSKIPQVIKYSIQYVHPLTGEDLFKKGEIIDFNSNKYPFMFDKQIGDKLMYKISFSVLPQIECEFQIETDELLK